MKLEEEAPLDHCSSLSRARGVSGLALISPRKVVGFPREALHCVLAVFLYSFCVCVCVYFGIR